jgi:uncharacterized RDD family membrane protein YckC
MSWYYAENNERRGPIEDADFQSLVSAGTIAPETLVWREGFAEWLPYSQASSAVTVPAPTASSSLATGLSSADTSAQACSQCGRLFPADEMVSYEGRSICAACKPIFFQKIKEGASVIGQREYAGFWIRVGAKIVDGIILQVAARILGLFVGLAFKGTDAAVWVAGGLGLIINAIYVIYFTGKYSATPGKMVCKLEVIRPDGSPLTFGRATGRYFAEILSSLTLGIGYLMVAWDDEKRALHDRVADTRVVRKQ